MEESDDICGLCGLPGADKIPHLCHWPNEAISDTGLVHADCEQEECQRAYSEFYRRVGENGIRNFIHNC
jgi:hypothetical protein